MRPDQSPLELVKDHRARPDRPGSRPSVTPPRASCRNTSSRASATSCQVSSHKSQPQNHISKSLKSPAKTEMTPGAEPKTSHTVTSPERPDEIRTMRDTSWPSLLARVGGSATGASMTTSYSRSTYSMRACATAPTGRNRCPESQAGWSLMSCERATWLASHPWLEQLSRPTTLVLLSCRVTKQSITVLIFTQGPAYSPAVPGHLK
jgi:hypothetical protein